MHSIFLLLAIKAGDHWELSPQEAKQVSDAVAAVGRHYPIMSSQKGADWSQLMIVVGVVFGPRLFTSWDMNRQRPAHSQQAQSPASAVAAAGRTAAVSPAASVPQPQPSTILTPAMLDPGSMSGSHATA